MTNQQPKLVVIGGGTGLPVILNQLRNQNVNITAVVTVADDGGSSGILRRDIKMVPPGDLKNVISALSTLPEMDKEVFQYRFKKQDQFLGGHTIGNLIIAALSEMNGGIYDAVQVLSKIMKVKGKVYPACDDLITLHAEFTDGSEVSGESEITGTNKKIRRAWVTKDDNDGEPKAVKPVIDAIMDADQIILGPGSLFTSILPNLLIRNVAEAVLKSSAQVVYICNIMTQNGETNNFSDADHVRILNQHLGKNFINTVLVNKTKVPANYIDENKFDESSQQVTHDEVGLEKQHCNYVGGDYLHLVNHGAYHNGKAVVRDLLKLLKFPQK